MSAPLRRSLIVFGAGTDVGKSVLSGAFVQGLLNRLDFQSAAYIKPLQTGGPDLDAAFVSANARLAGEGKALSLRTLFWWETAVSPHLAAVLEGKPLADGALLDGVLAELALPAPPACPAHVDVVETAGGVLSPAPSGTAQADVYEAMAGNVPAVLVGDGRLGGISATLTALESLVLRGFDVRGVVTIERSLGAGGGPAATRLDNSEAVRRVLEAAWRGGGRGDAHRRAAEGILGAGGVLALPELPPQPEPLDAWYAATAPALQRFLAGSLRLGGDGGAGGAGADGGAD